MGPTGSAYGAHVAWTTEFQKDTEVTVRIVGVESMVERWRYMKEGMFFTTADRFPDELIRAQGEGFASRDGGPFQLRLMYPCGKLDSGYVVRGDSDIKTPYDLKGKRIAFLVWDPTKTSMTALLAWGNVSPEDVEWVPAGGVAATQSLIMDGKADVTFAFTHSPGWFEAEAAPHSIRWLDLNSKAEPEAAARYLEVRPGYIFGPATVGVPTAQGVWMLNSIAQYITQAQSDTDLVYNVVKWLDENHDKYKDAHPFCAAMTIENLVWLAEHEFVPLHEGTQRYLEEKGLWTAAHDARWQQNIDLFTKWVEAYQTAIDMADEKGLKVDPENEEWVQFWMEYSAGTGLPPFQYFVQGLD
jgi:TRAP transporter TAXI family solute receptor